MARTKGGPRARARHKKVMKNAKGYYGRKKNTFRAAVQTVEKGMQYAYRDRRTKKRNFRALWIVRINAAARLHGLKYSSLINGLNLAGVELDRKSLSEIAIHDADAFAALAKQATDALTAKDKKAA